MENSTAVLQLLNLVAVIPLTKFSTLECQARPELFSNLLVGDDIYNFIMSNGAFF